MSAASTSHSHFTRQGLMGIVLVAAGLAVWAVLPTATNPSAAHQITPTQRKADALTEARALLVTENEEKALRILDQIIDSPNSQPEQIASAYFEKGKQAGNVGHFDESKDFLHKALSLINKVDHPLFWADIQIIVADIHIMSLECTEAVALAREIIGIREQHLPPRHPDILIAFEFLASALEAEGKGNDDVALYRRILELNESNLGANHPDLIPKLDSLAKHLMEAGKPAEAAYYLQRSLALTESLPGTPEKELTIRLEDLSIALIKAEKQAEAEPFVRRLLDIEEKHAERDQARRFRALVKLGDILMIKNQPEEAGPFFDHALLITNSIASLDSNFDIEIVDSLASFYHKSDRLADAESIYRKGLHLTNDPFAPWNQFKAKRLNVLSGLLEEMNRLQEAEPLLREASKIYLDGLVVREDNAGEALAAASNYLRAARELQISDEDIYKRLEAERSETKLSKERFDELWKEALAKNPRESGIEQIEPTK